MKTCPPGVICIENVSMFFIIICIMIVFYIIYFVFIQQKIRINNKPYEQIIIKEQQNRGGMFFAPDVPGDVLLNPYQPPLRDERYFFNTRGTVPINISTNVGAVDTNYRQMGILTPLNGKGKDNIIALMGRPLFTNRDKWQYYTISNQHNNVKLPVSVKGRSGSNEYGVDKVYNNDNVYVEGLNETYKVTVYDNDTIKYLPFL